VVEATLVVVAVVVPPVPRGMLFDFAIAPSPAVDAFLRGHVQSETFQGLLLDFVIAHSPEIETSLWGRLSTETVLR